MKISRKNAFRLASYLILLASVLSMPWWVSFVLALCFIFYFNHYYEAVFFAFLSDVLYVSPVAKFGGFALVSFSVVLVAVFLIEFLKKRMVFDF
jgi:hypothetical protein